VACAQPIELRAGTREFIELDEVLFGFVSEHAAKPVTAEHEPL
jgi:hypothetical protein